MARIQINSKILDNGVRLAKLEGALDIFSYGELKKYLEELSADAKDVQVVVDLSAVSYIASSGWSVLLSRRKLMRLAGGNLSVFGLNEDIRRVYDAMRIDKRLPCGAGVNEALDLLKEDDPV
jgi:anti-anti-sigma factor